MSIYSRNSVHTVSQWNIFDSRTNLYPDNRWSCSHCNGRFPSKGSTPGHIVQFQVLFSCRTSVDPDLFHYSKPSPRKQLQPPFARSNGRNRLKKRTASLHGLRSYAIITGRRWFRMANEASKDFNAMLQDSKGMPKIQIITDEKSIEKYGGSRMYFAPPLDYDRVMRQVPRGKGDHGRGAPRVLCTAKIRRILPTPSQRGSSCPSAPGPASSGPPTKRRTGAH